MSIKLYVGNLSFQTDSEELKELFEQAGTVKAEVVVEDRETGRSRGFGFVEMATREEGEAAIQQFNGKEFSGRDLTTSEARFREDRGGRWGSGDRGGSGWGSSDRGREYGRKRRGSSSTKRRDAEEVQPRNEDELRAADEVRAQLAEVDEIIQRLGRDRKEIDKLKRETRSNISELQRMIAA